MTLHRAHAAKRAQAEVTIGVLREQLVDLKAEHAAEKIDDAAFERSRAEIEQRVLEEGLVVEDGADQRPATAWALALILVMPLTALLVYGFIGEPDALNPETHVAQTKPEDVTPEQFAGLVAQLAKRLADSRMPADAVVYIFARPPEGGMPFAAIRFPASALPTHFDFRDAQRINDAPLPDDIVVAARISMNGDAAPRPGDREAMALRVSPAAGGVELVIDRVRD